MAYTDYTYDKTAELPANKLVNYEVQLTDRGIFCEHGAFYQTGLVVEGWTGSTWATLEEGEHFTFSPAFLTVSAGTGKWAYSYLVYTGEFNIYTKVRLSGQLVGGIEDRVLLDLVATEMTPSKRMYTYAWSRISTRYTMRENSYVPNQTNKDLLSVINSNLGVIATSLKTNHPDTDPSLIVRLQAVEAALNMT